MIADGNNWFSAIQVANFVGFGSLPALYRRIKANKFPAGTRDYINNRVVWPRKALEDYIKQREVNNHG